MSARTVELRRPPLPMACDSAVYGRLREDVAAYLRGGLHGRAWLIGGHRGAGKTTLVHQAVAAASAWEGLDALLVDLPVPLLGMSGGVDEPGEADDTTRLLRGIMARLFDAVARRVVDCFGRHLKKRPVRDRDELVEQLRVELRQAPTLARLREIWRRAGALEEGVFGAAESGAEEVAVVWEMTRARIMVSGKVSYRYSQEDEASQKILARTEGKVQGKDILNPLLGVLAAWTMAEGMGAMEAGQGGLLETGFAVLVGLGTTTALNLTTERMVRTSAQRAETFEPDTSPRALALELPRLITRLTAVGLRPVFVIDEIDRLPDACDRLQLLGDRIKQFVTNRAFFCFLVDRHEFEHVRRQVNEDGYGPAYTRFPTREFLTLRPGELYRWLERQLPADADAEARAYWQVLQRVFLSRGLMHPMDVRRQRALMTPEYTMTVPPREDWGRHGPDVLCQAAVEKHLAAKWLQEWVGEDGYRLQVALDALYAPVRAWRAGTPPPRDVEGLRAAIGARFAGGCEAEEIDPAVMRLLADEVAMLVDDLGDPVRWVQSVEAPEGVQWVLVDAPRLHNGDGVWCRDALGTPLPAQADNAETD